ncbi:phage tail assembly protein [Aurantimonas sp. VKM B-3413]|uniref:phage tail assembly protein n=1 Tax=Aurantimonas sp. VKM B-3413 TaxID=2779401 RepID=UPI001E3C4531|nr:phage tail assembly protein [Aurantimonas sp. VKM B-3413]MCB8835924.1 phage tail assembly protein [Aurantimonas sp. VKM B-3413]
MNDVIIKDGAVFSRVEVERAETAAAGEDAPAKAADDGRGYAALMAMAEALPDPDTGEQPKAERTADKEEGAGAAEAGPEVDETHRRADYDPGPPAVSVPVAYPFTLDGVRVDRIDLRPPARGDVEAVVAGQISELELHARMSGRTVAELRALRWPDTETVTIAARHLAPEIGGR